MKLHRNAKSTPASRLRMVQRVLCEGWSYAAVTEAFASVTGPWRSGSASPIERRLRHPWLGADHSRRLQADVMA
jgi:hypothetical protein